MLRCFFRSFSSKAPEFYVNALKQGQLFASIDANGVITNEASNELFFKESNQIKQTQFWRNLRKNNVRIHDDYEFVSRIGTQFVFVNSVDRPIVFHSYVNKTESILHDNSVEIDREDKDVNSKHGVLVYGNDILLPFIPKYLSMCLENNNLYFPLMNCHLGGMGKLSDQLAEYFRPFIYKSEKSERSGYMFKFGKIEYDVEAIELESIHPKRYYVCYNKNQPALLIIAFLLHRRDLSAWLLSFNRPIFLSNICIHR